MKLLILYYPNLSFLTKRMMWRLLNGHPDCTFTSNGKPYQNDHLEHLLSLGLAYIRQIFESTGEKQKSLFIRHTPRDVIRHLETQFITRAFECLGRNASQEDVPLLPKTDPPFAYEINAAIELGIPDAWQWADPRAPRLKLQESSLKGLRDLGYFSGISIAFVGLVSWSEVGLISGGLISGSSKWQMA